MSRVSKPYNRPESHKKGDPDAPGSWKHDLHDAVQSSLASRLSSTSRASTSSSASRPALLDRISGGKGKELLPSSKKPAPSTKLYGFDTSAPVNPARANSGVELLPANSSKQARETRASARPRGIVDEGQRNLVQSGLSSVLASNRQQVVRPAVSSVPEGGVSIFGAARGSTWVRIENLARGTTAEDVQSAFAPTPILAARRTSSHSDPVVIVELEIADRGSAEALIKQYDGVVADGQTLRLTIFRPVVPSRVESEAKAPVRSQHVSMPSSGKMYSDTIITNDVQPSGTTVGGHREPRLASGGSSLAARLGRR